MDLYETSFQVCLIGIKGKSVVNIAKKATCLCLSSLKPMQTYSKL